MSLRSNHIRQDKRPATRMWGSSMSCTCRAGQGFCSQEHGRATAASQPVAMSRMTATQRLSMQPATAESTMPVFQHKAVSDSRQAATLQAPAGCASLLCYSELAMCRAQRCWHPFSRTSFMEAACMQLRLSPERR